MKKTQQKTKVIRVRGGEMYFVRHEFEDGIRWEPYQKDLSAIIPAYRDTKFKATRSLLREPRPIDPSDLIRPLPADFATDLLGPYARLEYAEGHKPLPPLRLH